MNEELLYQEIRMLKEVGRKSYAKGYEECQNKVVGMLMLEMLQQREDGNITIANMIEELHRKVQEMPNEGLQAAS